MDNKHDYTSEWMLLLASAWSKWQIKNTVNPTQVSARYSFFVAIKKCFLHQMLQLNSWCHQIVTMKNSEQNRHHSGIVVITAVSICGRQTCTNNCRR